MWETLCKIIPSLLDFAKSSKKNAEDIKKLNQQVADLSTVLLKITLEMNHSKEMNETERKNLLLELEIILLRNSLKVPPSGIYSPRLPSKEEKDE